MRPSILPILLAQLVEQAPSRVRNRLDKEPSVAEGWVWTTTETGWSIQANEETVRLHTTDGLVQRMEDIVCTCLLSPKCFHVLACCTSLPLQQSLQDLPPPDTTLDSQPKPAPTETTAEGVSNAVAVTDTMRSAARQVQQSLSSLLQVGAKNAGLLLQSGLLRAGHAGRAADLFSLSNTVLRIAEGVQRFRQQLDTSDSESLKQDVATALLTCHLIGSQSSVPRWVVGQARRSFEPIDVRKLHGVFAEPILTRSGYAGVCVYLQDASGDSLYTVNDLRTGDSSLIAQAYRGGIDLGGIVMDASSICRTTFSVQELSASEEGRLSKGKSTRWATAKPELTPHFTSGRFAKSLESQLERVFSFLEVPSEVRPGGWDLVSLTGTVLGALGARIAFEVETAKSLWTLGILVDEPEVEYRHNLELLARCRGLRMRCLVRIRTNTPRCGDLVAIANANSESLSPNQNQESPRLDLPDTWQGICNVGLDRLERHRIVGISRWPEDVTIESDDVDVTAASSKFIRAIDRRLIGMVLSGKDAVQPVGSMAHQRDRATFQKMLMPTAVKILDALSSSAHENDTRNHYQRSSIDSSKDSGLVQAFLACERYTNVVQLSLLKSSF